MQGKVGGQWRALRDNSVAPMYKTVRRRKRHVMHLQLKREVMGSIPGGFPAIVFFSLPAGFLINNIDKMKKL